MRPPEHWHLRRRKRLPWRSIFFLIAPLLAVSLLFVWCSARSGGTDLTAGSTCQGDACAPPAGTPSLLHEGNEPPPRIRGKAAVVMEASCGEPLYLRNADQPLPPASLTKIMTALVAAQLGDLDRLVDVRVNSALMAASTGSTVMGLEPGLRMTMRDLLYGLLLPSGNDAAVAIAEEVAGSVPEFVDRMNAQASLMGLTGTHFSNPHGLDEPGLYSSATDIALLGRALLANRELGQIVRTKHYQPAWDGPEVWNGNELLDAYPGTIGVKIGYTERAGQTIVAAADRDGRRLIVSVLGSWDRYGDAVALFDWAVASTEPACS